MTKTCYTFTGFYGLYMRIVRIWCWVFPLITTFSFVAIAFSSTSASNSGGSPDVPVSTWVFALCFGLFFLLMPWGVMLVVSENTAEICVDDEGLLVSSMLGWRRVAWEDVVDVLERRMIFRQTSFVVVRKPALGHYLMGFAYMLYSLQGYVPGFLVAQQLENQPELIATIRQHLPARSS